MIKLLDRKMLKGMKKDIEEQIKAGVEKEELFIESFYYIGDGIYEWNDAYKAEPRFVGNITKKEKEANRIESFKKIKSQGNYKITIQVYDDIDDVDFYIEATSLDTEAYDLEEKEYIMLCV